jgi:ComF family protein
MPLATEGAPCPHCFGKGDKPFEKLVRLGVYQDPLKRLIHQVKYHGRWELAAMLADRLTQQARVKSILGEECVIVPVPLHPWREISRGYNQADLVARRLAKRFGRKLARVLVRLQNTETQTHIHSKEHRYENLRDAFGLMRAGPIRGKHVILVDDVKTTGATLTWAARTIAEAEPARISAIVLAIADPRGRGFERI